MHLLVTGGAGFIGSHFVLRHIAQFPADKVVVLDKLTYAADKKFLDPVIQKIEFVEGDIADTSHVSNLVSQFSIDTIVNFAAESHVDRSIESAAPFLETNVLGVQSLIEVCRAHPVARLLHVSTDEVYGDVDDDGPSKKIEDALWPSSPYAASKAAGEMLLFAAMRTHGIETCISRCTNNYGPHQASEKFIPTVIRHALKDQPVPIYAKGKNKRDWLYVTDHCDALELLLRAEGLFGLQDASILPVLSLPKYASTSSRVAPIVSRGVSRDSTGATQHDAGHVFNIAGRNEHENIEVAKMILDILGKPHSLLTSVPDRPGHDWRYAVEDSAIRKLGWQPKVSFEEGLKRTVGWYRSRI